MENIIHQFRFFLVILFVLMAVIFILLAIFSSFKYLDGFSVSIRTLKISSVYYFLFMISTLLALIIYDPSFINGALLLLIISTILILAYYFVGKIVINIKNKILK